MLRTGLLLASSTLLITAASHAQYAPPDCGALEQITVETYYISDANDAADEDGGGVPQLLAGAKTYRIYVDMKPGYSLESVYGDATHALDLTTTTQFWNNTDRGEVTGDLIDAGRLDENTVALDSWLSMGAASDAHWGVLKTEDNDGSAVGGANNDGGSNGVPGGLLVNADINAGIPLTTADGLIPGTVPAVTAVGVDLSMFSDVPGASFNVTNGAWAVLGGTMGATAENRVLIAQLTTNGQLSFNLNMRIHIPDSLQCQSPGCHVNMDFFATIQPADTAGGDITTDNVCTHPTLIFSGQVVDCLGVPGGGALPGTTCDDGDATTGNDAYGNNCVCAGQLIDCLQVPGGGALPGTPCDDNNPNTLNDTWSAICTCEGSSGMDEIGQDVYIATFPSPVKEQLTLSIATVHNVPMSIVLRDALGQVVLRKDLGTVSGERKETIDMGSFARGVYALEVMYGNTATIRRISKY
ncbi:MAG: T9SS type A sorting domain-containing protein [Flavobacteriales bacterium]